MIFGLLVVTLLLASYSLIIDDNRLAPQRGMYWTCVVILFLIAAFRYEFGYDFENYRTLYNLSANLEELLLGNATNEMARGIAIEPGYLLLNSFSKYLSEPAGLTIVFFVGSLISVVLLSYVIIKRSSSPALSLIYLFGMYMLQQHLGQVRQAIAVSLGIFAFHLWVTNKRKLVFISLVAIASTFHITSIVFLVFPFIKSDILDSSKKRKFLVFFTLIIYFLGYFGGVKTGLELVVNALPLPDFLQKYITAYITADFYRGRLTILSIPSVLRITTSLYILIRYSTFENKAHFIMRGIMLYILGSWLYFLFIDFSVIAGRVTLPFKYFDIFLYPFLLNRIKNAYLRIGATICFVLFSIAIILNELLNNIGIYSI